MIYCTDNKCVAVIYVKNIILKGIDYLIKEFKATGLRAYVEKMDFETL